MPRRAAQPAPPPERERRTPYPEQWDAWSDAERRAINIRQRSWPKGTTAEEMEDYAGDIVRWLDSVAEETSRMDPEALDAFVAEWRAKLEDNRSELEHIRILGPQLIAARGPIMQALVLAGVLQTDVARWAGVWPTVVGNTIGTSVDSGTPAKKPAKKRTAAAGNDSAARARAEVAAARRARYSPAEQPAPAKAERPPRKARTRVAR